jgi:quercetin dioxygenase-like cupin family protein
VPDLHAVTHAVICELPPVAQISNLRSTQIIVCAKHGEKIVEQRTVTHHRWNDIPEEPLSDVLSRKLITGDRMMLAHVYLKKGAIVPRHSHENEQLTYILEGGLRFWIGADEAQVIDVLAGEVLHIPSHVPHKAEALEDTLDVDVFSPPRQDWLDKTDDYLRQK